MHEFVAKESEMKRDEHRKVVLNRLPEIDIRPYKKQTADATIPCGRIHMLASAWRARTAFFFPFVCNKQLTELSEYQPQAHLVRNKWLFLSCTNEHIQNVMMWMENSCRHLIWVFPQLLFFALTSSMSQNWTMLQQTFQ